MAPQPIPHRGHHYHGDDDNDGWNPLPSSAGSNIPAGATTISTPANMVHRNTGPNIVAIVVPIVILAVLAIALVSGWLLWRRRRDSKAARDAEAVVMGSKTEEVTTVTGGENFQPPPPRYEDSSADRSLNSAPPTSDEAPPPNPYNEPRPASVPDEDVVVDGRRPASPVSPLSTGSGTTRTSELYRA